MHSPTAPRPFDFFSAIFCLNLDREPLRWLVAEWRHRALGIATRVERVSAVDTPIDHHVGCALSWRSMIVEAQRRGYENVLILEDDAIFRHDTHDVLSEATDEIVGIEWDLFYLGGALHGTPTTAIESRHALRRCGYIACTHALAVHERCYQFLIEAIPEGGSELDAWIQKWLAIDQFFGMSIASGSLSAVVTQPRVATQRELTAWSDGDLATADAFVYGPTRQLGGMQRVDTGGTVADNGVLEPASGPEDGHGTGAFGLDVSPIDDVTASVDQLRGQGHLRPRDAAERPVRVLAFTPSRDRPVLLRHCILQMRAQTYPVDHSVYLNGEEDDRRLYHDLITEPLFLEHGPSHSDQHLNYLAALRGIRLDDYDLFCKVDDDDIYHLDYIEGVVADFVRHGWDYSGSHSDGWIRGRHWLSGKNLPGLGPHSDFDLALGVLYILPPTAAFSRRAIECLLGIDLTSPAPELQLDGVHVDVLWGRTIAKAGLVSRVRHGSSFTYNVHGGNLSTAGWLGPDDI